MLTSRRRGEVGDGVDEVHEDESGYKGDADPGMGRRLLVTMIVSSYAIVKGGLLWAIDIPNGYWISVLYQFVCIRQPVGVGI